MVPHISQKELIFLNTALDVRVSLRLFFALDFCDCKIALVLSFILDYLSV